MWRFSSILMRQGLSSAVKNGRKQPLATRGSWQAIQDCGCLSATSYLSSSIFLFKPAALSTSSSDSGNSNSGGGEKGNGLSGGASKVGEGETVTFAEAKKLMRLVNVEALKMKLGMEGKEVIGYPELLEACESMGVARSLDEAITFAKVLDEAGVVLLFRDKVYLHPDKVHTWVHRQEPRSLVDFVGKAKQ